MESKGFSPDFLDALMNYEWPGNIRELINTIEQSLSRAGNENILYPRHLPKTIRSKVARRALEKKLLPEAQLETETMDITDFPELKSYRARKTAEIEKRYLKKLMEITGGNIKLACQMSGLSRARLYALIKQYCISRNS